jgi:hypothetical protein
MHISQWTFAGGISGVPLFERLVPFLETKLTEAMIRASFRFHLVELEKLHY